jgi:hypothetical protein
VTKKVVSVFVLVQRKNNKADVARDGLEPLAKIIMAQNNVMYLIATNI